MRSLLGAIRRRFKPFFHARKYAAVRSLVKLVDAPVWLHIPGVEFKIRGMRIAHGVAYGLSGSPEPNHEALIRSCVRTLAPHAFWDVGANLGLYSWIVKTESPQTEVVLFEPLPANQALIRHTVSGNQLSGVSLVEAAVSDRIGQLMLYPDEVGDATASPEAEADSITLHDWGLMPGLLEVTMVTIDSERARSGAVDMLKIDVEGHEASVIRGGMKTIRSDQPVIFIGCFHPRASCLSPLVECGYKIIDGDTLNPRTGPKTSNFFALPPRHLPRLDALLSSARRLARGR